MIGPGTQLVGLWLSDEWRFRRDGDEVSVPGTVVEVVRVADATRADGYLFVGQVLDAETQAPIGEICRTGLRWRMRHWWFAKAPGAPLPDELEQDVMASVPRDRAGLQDS